MVGDDLLEEPGQIDHVHRERSHRFLAITVSDEDPPDDVVEDRKLESDGLDAAALAALFEGGDEVLGGDGPFPPREVGVEGELEHYSFGPQHGIAEEGMLLVLED